MEKSAGQDGGKVNERYRDYKSFISTILFSLVLSLTTDLVASSHSFSLFSTTVDHEVIRAWIYCGIAYIGIVPVAAYSMRRSMSGFRPKKGGVFDRFVYLILGLTISIPLFYSPILFLTLASENVGRSHLVYVWLTGSAFGLGVIGGALFYGAAVGIWLATAAINHVFKH